MKAIEELEELIEQQACDDGLWFPADNAVIAYLQQELRKLHEICEQVIKENKQ